MLSHQGTESNYWPVCNLNLSGECSRNSNHIDCAFPLLRQFHERASYDPTMSDPPACKIAVMENLVSKITISPTTDIQNYNKNFSTAPRPERPDTASLWYWSLYRAVLSSSNQSGRAFFSFLYFVKKQLKSLINVNVSNPSVKAFLLSAFQFR